MNTSYKKKLIEVALPLEDINREAAREKSIRHAAMLAKFVDIGDKYFLQIDPTWCFTRDGSLKHSRWEDLIRTIRIMSVWTDAEGTLLRMNVPAQTLDMALFPRSSFVQFNSTKDLMVIFGTILVSSIQGPMLDLSEHDYRYTLLAGAVFSLLCLLCLLRLQSGRLAMQVAIR